MKFKLLLFLFISASLSAFSQVKPIYFNGNSITNDKSLATSYGVYGKLSDQNLWVLKRYDLDDNLMLSGTYNDELLTIPNGKFIFYSSIQDYNDMNATFYKMQNIDRYIIQEGTFVSGLEEGKWTDYYPDGAVYAERIYKNGKLNGELRVYSAKGKILFIGAFKDDIKDGIFYDLKKRRKQTYAAGILTEDIKLTKEQSETIN